MKKFGWVLGCALALLGSRAPASAQVSSDLSQGWQLRAGFFVPERSAPRAEQGDIWLTVGAEKAFYAIDRWQGTISVDYYGSGRLYNVPIQINARGMTKRLRFGAGMGVGISHDLEQGILGVAYNLLVGYELIQGTNPVSFDVRYNGQSTGAGQLNGWSFTFGYGF